MALAAVIVKDENTFRGEVSLVLSYLIYRIETHDCKPYLYVIFQIGQVL